jgi:CMP-N-acetylneuraminic acid synthetase
MRAYALIPARSGSKGLPDKNILPIAGHPLLAYSIAFGRTIPVERVILSTDSPRYAEIGRAYGAECPLLRGAQAASDTAMEEDILADLDARLPGLGIPLPDIWVWLKPTCPFRDPAAVAEGIAALRDRPELDSVRIVTEADARLHRINAEGYLEPAPPSWDPTRSKMRRSEFEKVYQPFNLEIFRHEGWRARGSLFMGRRIHPIVLPRITGLDVDDRDGFDLIRTLIEADPRPELVGRHILLPPVPARPDPGKAAFETRAKAFRAADEPGKIALLVELLQESEAQHSSQRILDLARNWLGPLRAACEAVLAGAPTHRVALRSLAWCAYRTRDFALARKTLARLLALWPDQSQDSHRELMRLAWLDPMADEASQSAAWEVAMAEADALSQRSYTAQDRFATGKITDTIALDATLDRLLAEALAEIAAAGGPAAETVERLRAAKSVAIVGNGPSLKGSGAGARIEAHELVLRINYPVLSGFAADVGTRTDVMLFDGAHRLHLDKRLAREPAYPKVAALGTPTGILPGPVKPGEPPEVPISLIRLISALSYGRGTTGFRAIVLVALILRRKATLFGFDFFQPGQQGHYYDAASAALQHELAYEEWFVTRFLPTIRPDVSRFQPGASGG